MMTISTLALIVVAIIAPTRRKAARPANRRQDSQAAKTMKTKTSAPTIVSPFSPLAEDAADAVVDQPEGDEEARAR